MKGFQKTHSQIARQLGLYYCDAQGICHPRFTEDVSLDTIFKYGQYWARHYFVPNPFTKSFPQNCSPTCVYGYFLAHAEALLFDINAIFGEMFGINMADLDKAKSYLFNFTELTEVDDGKVSVPGECVRVDESVLLQRDDELAYYHYFDGWGIGECGTPILVESSLRLFAKKVFVYLSEHEDGLQSVFSKCEQYSIASGEARLKIVNSNPDVYLTGLFMHESQAHVNGANANDTHERWHADYDFQGLGGSNFLSGEWSLREYKENKPDVRLALTYPSFKRLVEWLYPKYEISKSDDDVFCFSRLKLQERFAGNVLSIALGVFSERRQKLDWCADNTGGDANKPQMGFVANKMLRAAVPQTSNLNTDAKVAAWFKQYYNPDGKGWIDGDNTIGYAAFGGFIDYLVNGGTSVPRPQDFSRKLERAIKTVIEPAANAMYDARVNEVLKFLGLIGFDFKEDFDEDDYQDALHAQRVIKRRLKDMGEKQIVEWDAAANQAKPNDKEPDFLTVNEFLWFAFDEENRKEISRIAKEKAMAKQQKKPTKDKVTTGTATISGLLANKEDSLMTMLTAALLTKPLVILAGVSGTGKSRMVRHLAYKTCLDKDLQPQGGNAPGNFKMIQVKPNWHDSADLLGYRSVVSGNHEFVTTEFVKFVLKAHAYPDTPFFVCLDEMNLAPVEHYFAEFLSACESIRKNEQGVWISDPIVSPTDFDGEIINLGGDVKFESDDATLDAALKARKALIEKEGLFIPRNLFVVGTVNMDDTTNGFSRKVLDRAMTIEMNEVKFDELQKKDEGLSVAAANVFNPEEIKKFIDREDFDGQTMLNDEFRDQMEALRGKLEKSPFALAYRFARETTLYRKALMTILDPAEVVKDANGAPKKDAASAPIDAKRACGEIALDHMILMKVLPRFTGTVTERETIIKDVGEYLDALIKDKKVGKVKLDDMVERAKHNGGYLSFWP